MIDLGQLGDVVMSLPALAAVRNRFPHSHIAVVTGKPPESVVRMSGLADEIISIDRVALRDGPKLASIGKLLQFTAEFRRRRIDLLIDLHSLPETNILAYVSRAKYRLLANRESRSLDFLSNFSPRPPKEDKSKHLTDIYLNVLRPLGIENADPEFRLTAPAADAEYVESKYFSDKSSKIVGLFPGAGHPSRRWELEKFAELATRLEADGFRTAVFLGPEEVEMREGVKSLFPPAASVIDDLSIPGLVAAATHLAAVITNDTGTMHVTASAGAPILLLLDSRAPETYVPRTEKLEVLRGEPIWDIPLDDAYRAAQSILSRF